jgi:hypothetical protein
MGLGWLGSQTHSPGPRVAGPSLRGRRRGHGAFSMRQPRSSSSHHDGPHHARECQRLAPAWARGRHPADERARLEPAADPGRQLVSRCQHLTPTLFPPCRECGCPCAVTGRRLALHRGRMYLRRVFGPGWWASSSSLRRSALKFTGLCVGSCASKSTAFPRMGTLKTKSVRISVAIRASRGESVRVTERRRGSRAGTGCACASVPREGRAQRPASRVGASVRYLRGRLP